MFKYKSILMLGIGGVSMHQLALACKKSGVMVFGYDLKRSAYTDAIESEKIPFTTHFKKEFLQVEACVKTAAIKDDNKYVVALKKLGVPIIDRAVFLGEISREFKCVIAVAGTHGKSTTASLIYEILRAAGKKVSSHIGADVFAPRFEFGDEYLVVEACEFNKSFLSIYPDIAVITNVEAEHMDSYKTMFNLRLAFKSFSNRAKIRFAFDEKSTHFLGKNAYFVPITKAKISPKLKGEYNLKNISLALAVANYLKIDEKSTLKVINSFVGVPRRYEYIGQIGKQKAYIDYAHHPSELKAFISTFLSENPNGTIVFQPHTYSRTKLLLKDFLSVLSGVKNLIIFKEYPAREKRAAGLTAHELFDLVKVQNKSVRYCASASGLARLVLGKGNLAFVGAGDINTIAHRLVEKF